MKLGGLTAVLKTPTVLPSRWLDREITDITQDSRKAGPGSLFVAVRGFHSDGHQFIPQAIRQGAAAIVAEKPAAPAAEADTPVIIVDDSRAALARLACAFFGYPSRRLKLVGITGTNGKTTTTYVLKSIIESAGHVCGLIGTIDYRIADRVYPAPNTTPESIDLQRLLDEMAGFGASYCVMEVSSHALALGRTEGCEFAAAGFTNLTQDHLDFHESMDAYFRAKQLLFTGLAPGSTAVINCDDARGEELIGSTRANVITFGFSEQADVRPAGAITHGISGLRFEAATPCGRFPVESPLVGRHNIYNILTAIGLAVALGLDTRAIMHGIGTMKAVPGRMETVQEGQPYGVVVDYAHTEDALVRLLEAIREIAKERIITVFGCGGDRDRTKRPRMGAAAARGSDVVIITSDNPRNEDPLSIIREIEAGMAGHAVMAGHGAESAAGGGTVPYLIIPDRREAIAAAVQMAKSGDVVVLAGKGHEDYQVIGTMKLHFDDREAARDEIRKQRMTTVR